jgi:hypothetical protein
MARSNRAELFNQGMASMARVVSAVLAGYDFSGISTRMDVGGGVGELMSGDPEEIFVDARHRFRSPHSAEGARKNLAASGVADRCEFIGEASLNLNQCPRVQK